MILVFGGTTEGRISIKTLDEGTGSYYYSTRGNTQPVECAHGIHISGTMKEQDIMDFCRSHGIRLIVDAAHPFATCLHSAIAKAAASLRIPVVRFERRYPDNLPDSIIWCDDYDDAIRRVKQNGVNRLLALTGVQTIPRLREFWERNETYFRILDRKESFEIALETGFPKERLVTYGKDNTGELLDKLLPDAIISKESGESGGFEEKITEAVARGVAVYVVRRPKLPAGFIIVDGRHGLRREIEAAIPEFYPLHTGVTTGSCATAAAKAALTALLTGTILDDVRFRIPEGETIHMAVERVTIGKDYATASVIKDAGDDPDVTDKSRITVTVAYASHKGIKFFGGKGIGTVTLPGLGLEVGSPAINPVPRAMMTRELSERYPGGLDVTVSLENGESLAEKTFNPKVGITGGVSIIGTSGIVRPFSHEAFMESIRRELNVATALNCERVVVNSGGKSQKYLMRLYPELPLQAFVQYGNAIGEILRMAEEMKIHCLTIGLMLGKAVKLAEGHMDTHSHKVTLNKSFIIGIAKESECSAETIKAIGNLSFARELPALVPEYEAHSFFHNLLKRCHKQCATVFTGNLESVLISDDGSILDRIMS